MQLIFTYTDNETGEEIMDFGVDTETNKVFSVPQEKIDCITQKLEYIEAHTYFVKE
jgi:hypothetical protein